MTDIAKIANGLSERVKGPVETLCDEIGFRFDRRMERDEILVAFVAELIAVIRHGREIALAITEMTGKPPSEGSNEVLNLCDDMLNAEGAPAIIEAARIIHEACDRLNPEDSYPTDHIIDMLQSCASALRFGLEKPCKSRHAASAAHHVWKRTYGISLFDNHTPEWSSSWARAKLSDAILGLAVRDYLERQGND